MIDMNTLGILRQLVGIICMIVALVAVIRIQQGFELQQLIDQPSLLWNNMWTERGY